MPSETKCQCGLLMLTGGAYISIHHPSKCGQLTKAQAELVLYALRRDREEQLTATQEAAPQSDATK